MSDIKGWIQRIMGYGRSSIRRQVLFLVLSCGFFAFLTVSLLSLYTMENTIETLAEQGHVMEESVAESVGNFTKDRDKLWLEAAAMDEAGYVDREMAFDGENVGCLANSMSLILAMPEYYRPRQLPSTADSVEIVSGMPYLHYSPELMRRGIDEELAQEIALASNFATVLASVGKSYENYHTSLFVASRKGYMICVDMIPESDGKQNVFPSEERRKEFVENYEPRVRPWYTEAERKGKLIYTDVYVGEDGFLELACAMPYYDSEGFAGVVGIGGSIEDIHGEIVDAAIGNTGISFVLDSKGNVVISSQQEGILAATPESFDVRNTEEPSLAEAARHMVAGESDVLQVAVDGEEYYLAFAPMKKIGWSYGTLIGKEEVMAPARQASEQVRREMGTFKAVLKDIFASAMGNAMLLILPILLISFYGSGRMADRITRPIHSLTEGVREIAGGNLDKKLDIRTGNEIEHLAICFNSMTDELKRHIESLSHVVAEKERVRTELEVAANIQAGMLPDALKRGPYSKIFDLVAVMHPAKEVGGDFYDFYFLDEDHLVFTVADVSDKGVPAALFMVIAKTLLKEHALMDKSAEHLARVVAEANDALAKSNREFMFVTAFIGMIHLPSGRFTYVNAGHNPPLVQRGGSFEYLPLAKNPVLGIKGGIRFVEQRLTLAAGDAIFLYTDGVTEAMDEKQELFTEERLKEALNSMQNPAHLQAEDILSRVQDAVQKHVGEANQSDDITMMGFVYYGNDHYTGAR